MTKEIEVLPISLYVDKPGRFEQYYYLPTKDRTFKPLSLRELEYHVDNFLKYAHKFSLVKFKVPYIESKSDKRVASMFEKAPSNVRLPEEFLKVLGRESKTKFYADMLVKEGLSTKSHAEYCLKLINEFKPDLEEFINAMLDEAWHDGRENADPM